MKLVRWGVRGGERPGIVDGDGRVRDLSEHVADIGGGNLSPTALDTLRGLDLGTLPLVPLGERLGACVGGVGKFICIGLNFADHARETGAVPPVEPVVFMKATSAIAGPDDNVMLPRGSTKTDWEVELGVVIGVGGKYIAEAAAMAHVAGYCVINDLSVKAATGSDRSARGW
jgi:2,4-diketo-3-deoxy-L-fuconate hydrolase